MENNNSDDRLSVCCVVSVSCKLVRAQQNREDE